MSFEATTYVFYLIVVSATQNCDKQIVSLCEAKAWRSSNGFRCEKSCDGFIVVVLFNFGTNIVNVSRALHVSSIDSSSSLLHDVSGPEEKNVAVIREDDVNYPGFVQPGELSLGLTWSLVQSIATLSSPHGTTEQRTVYQENPNAEMSSCASLVSQWGVAVMTFVPRLTDGRASPSNTNRTTNANRSRRARR